VLGCPKRCKLAKRIVDLLRETLRALKRPGRARTERLVEEEVRDCRLVLKHDRGRRDLGVGRIVASEIEAPNVLATWYKSG
jgi:hypothetical protein